MPLTYLSKYGTSWALVIGINSYEHAPPLTIACNDADAVSATLVDELGFLPANVFVLKNSKATKQAILDSYLAFGRMCEPDDRVFVFFAGHGTTVEGNKKPVGYLVPCDGRLENLNSLIRWDEFVSGAEVIRAKHVLFVMDACYSGLLMQRALPAGEQRFLSDMLQRYSRQAITAGKANETVADGGGPDGKNSIFTGYFLEGLKGKAANASGVITASELMNYVYRKVSQDPRSQQSPHYGHLDGDGEFVLKTQQSAVANTVDHPDQLAMMPPEIPESLPDATAHSREPTFLKTIGYADPTSSKFGRNDCTEKLGEPNYRGPNESFVPKVTGSWIGLVIEPTTNQSLKIDLAKIVKALPGRQWKNQPPFPGSLVPRSAITTFNSAIFYEDHGERQPWARFLRIDRNGNLELGDRATVVHFFQPKPDGNLNDGFVCFLYVQLIGMVLGFVDLAKTLLNEAGYSGGCRLTINLVGTKGSLLVHFANEAGKDEKKWAQPTDGFGRQVLQLPKMICREENLQMQFRMVLANVTEPDLKKIAWETAENLGLAYNHQSEPRCFNYGTDVFPWPQYQR